MFEERLREHIESLATPVDVAEIYERAAATNDSTPSELSDDVSSSGAHQESEPSWMEFSPIWDDDSVVGAESDSHVKQGSRARAFAIAAIAILVALVAIGVVGRLIEQPVATEGGVPEQPDDSIPADAVWVELADPFPSTDEGNVPVVFDVVESGGFFWAAGREQFSLNGELNGEFAESLGLRPTSKPAIWRSGDGITWQPVDIFGPAEEPTEGVFYEEFFTAIVGTDDGEVWAFGESTRFSDLDGGTITEGGLVYRTTNGSDWEAMTFPPVETTPLGDPSQFLVSAWADGNTIVTVFETGFVVTNDENGDRLEVPPMVSAFSTQDGLTWEQIGETRSAETTDYAFFDGDLVAFESSLLPESEVLYVEVHHGTDMLIASERRAQGGRSLWRLTNSGAWVPLEVPQPAGRETTRVRSGSHSGGITLALHWEDRESTGVDVFNVDPSGTITALPEVPDIEVFDGFGGRSLIALVDEDESDRGPLWLPGQSIWRLESPSPEGSSE